MLIKTAVTNYLLENHSKNEAKSRNYAYFHNFFTLGSLSSTRSSQDKDDIVFSGHVPISLAAQVPVSGAYNISD